jgi:hypothetical protein
MADCGSVTAGADEHPSEPAPANEVQEESHPNCAGDDGEAVNHLSTRCLIIDPEFASTDPLCP